MTEPRDKEVLLTDARVISMGAAGIIDNGYLKLSGNLISKLGPMSELTAEEKASGDSMRGHTVMPGLINSHMHLHMLRPKFKYDPKDSGALDTMRSMRSVFNCFREGVTTIRDMGHHDGVRLELKQLFHSGVLLGPRMVMSGDALSMSFGHAWWLVDMGIKTTEELTHQVRKQVAEGADFIKIIASNEDLKKPGWDGLVVPWMSQEALNATVEMSHDCGMFVAVHANAYETLRRCIVAKVDSIEHGRGLTREQCVEMRDMGMWLVPTLSQQKRGADPSSGRPWQPRMAAMYPLGQQSARDAVEVGVRMAGGTDVQGTMAEEVQLFRDAGMGAEDSLRTVTINGAEMLKLDAEIGSLDPGKSASVTTDWNLRQLGVGLDKIQSNVTRATLE